MTFQWNCYCTPCYRAAKRITVENRQIVSVKYDRNANINTTLCNLVEPMSLNAAYYKTIPQLFNDITNGLTSNYHSVQATYDDVLGYPKTGILAKKCP